MPREHSLVLIPIKDINTQQEHLRGVVCDPQVTKMEHGGGGVVALEQHAAGCKSYGGKISSIDGAKTVRGDPVRLDGESKGSTKSLGDDGYG